MRKKRAASLRRLARQYAAEAKAAGEPSVNVK
jgi:hypothetical protein